MEPLDPLAVKFRRSNRLWQIAGIVACVVAVVLTCIFVWVVTKPTVSTLLPASKQDTRTVDSPCPRQPPLLPLPSPLPKRMTDALTTIDNHLKSLAKTAENKSAMSMNIFYRDSIIWSGHYGSKIFKGSSPPDNNTRYRIGSVTKIFAVILLYKLYEDGLISSLDDPLNKYAANFHINNPFTGSNITLRQIACQMSGLPREAPCVYRCSNTSSTEQLALLSNRTLVVEPFTIPSYSNLGYTLLGRLLTENLLNTTFEEWTVKEVLQPLGMKNTGFFITDKVKKNMAFPYNADGTIFPFMTLGWSAPAGEVYSTVEDLMKLASMFTKPNGKGILQQGTIREMVLPDFITRGGLWLWGSPWEIRFVKSYVARQKGGNIDTYNAVFSVIPEMQLALSVLVNYAPAYPKGSFTCFMVADFIHNKILPALNETLFNLRDQATFPIDAKAFTGTYVATQISPLTGKTIQYIMVIKQHKDTLTVLPSIKPEAGFIVTYIGKPLLFQAKALSAVTGPCLNAHLGVYGTITFDPPGPDGLSGAFSVPDWSVTAKRITNDSQIALDEQAPQIGPPQVNGPFFPGPY